MALSPAQRSFFVKDQIVGPAVFNFFLSAVLSWFAFRHHVPVTWKGDPGIARDLIGTLFLLPFLLALITNRLARHAAHRHAVSPFRFGLEVPVWVQKLPAQRYARAALLGLLTLVVLGPVLFAAFRGLGIEQMALKHFVVFKAFLGGTLAAVIAPIAALYALGDEAEQGRHARAHGRIAPAE